MSLQIPIRRKVELALVAYLKTFQGAGEPLEGRTILTSKEAQTVTATRKVVVHAESAKPEVEGSFQVGIHEVTVKVACLSQADDVAASDDDAGASAIQAILCSQTDVQAALNAPAANRPVCDFFVGRIYYAESNAVYDERTWGEELTFELIVADYDP